MKKNTGSKELELENLASLLGAKIDSQYKDRHSDPEWTRQVAETLSALSARSINRLRLLIETGPIGNPER